MCFIVPSSWLISNKKVTSLKLFPIYQKIGNKEPYKSGYRGVGLSHKILINWLITHVVWRGEEQSTNSPRGLASETPIAISFAWCVALLKRYLVHWEKKSTRLRYTVLKYSEFVKISSTLVSVPCYEFFFPLSVVSLVVFCWDRSCCFFASFFIGQCFCDACNCLWGCFIMVA